MTEQHEDPKFEQWLKDATRTTYHAPRTPPREERANDGAKSEPAPKAAASQPPRRVKRKKRAKR